MASKVSKYDSRLIGTWISDRRRTFRNYKPKRGVEPKNLRKLKSLFGKFIIRWGRGKYYTQLGSYRDTFNYEVLGRDTDSVVIRYWCDIYEEYTLRQIHFEGDCYFVALGGGLCEYFRRV